MLVSHLPEHSFRAQSPSGLPFHLRRPRTNPALPPAENPEPSKKHLLPAFLCESLLRVHG